MSAFHQTYSLKSWKGWDHQIHFSVLDFKNSFGIFPNSMEANEFTFAKIDIRADKEKIKGAASEKTGLHEYVKLGGFAASSGKYELEFFMNHKLPDKSYILMIDSEPGEKEPLPEEAEFESARVAVGGSK